jgi:hypothetical protein
MNQRTLGRTALTVSPLAHGTMRSSLCALPDTKRRALAVDALLAILAFFNFSLSPPLKLRGDVDRQEAEEIV